MKITMQNRFTRLVPIAVLVAIVALLFGAPVMANHDPQAGASSTYADPVFLIGNDNCAERSDAEFEFRHEPVTSGTFPLLAGGVQIGSITIVVRDTTLGPVFDWTATIPIEDIVVKGGPNANLFAYNPTRTSDQGLHAPVNLSNGKYSGLSHISFCFNELVPLTATKTAAGTYDRTITWELDKSVAPELHTGNAGEVAGSSTWEVVATKTVVEDNYQVTGEITVSNSNNVPVEFFINDMLNDGTPVTVICPGEVNGFVNAPANGSLICTYVASPDDGSATLNTAIINPTSAGMDPTEATAPVSFTANVIGDENVAVDDNRDTEGQFPSPISSSTTYDYDETFTCSSNQADYTNGVDVDTYPNTATLTGPNTNLSDSASVTVTCTLDALEPTKTAAGSYARTITWTLDKSVDPESHTGNAGEVAGSSIWTVTATKTVVEDNYQVTGSITIVNPAAIPQTFSVSDVLSDGTIASVNCPSNTVPAGGQVVCSYSASPSDGAATLNTATVSAVGNPAQEATAPVSFTANVIGDETVTAEDARDDEGNFPAGISDTTTFDYDETFYCSSNAADYTNGVDVDTYPNTATLTGDNTNLSDSASVTVTCYAPVVWKDATATFDRDWTWDIVKTGPLGPIVLQDSQSYMVDYQVEVTATYEDTESVVGTIYVKNLGGDPMVVSLADTLDDATVADITGCNPGSWNDATQEVTVAAGETAECAYVAAPLDQDNSVNTVSYSFGDLDGTASSVPYEYTLDVETDECVVVDDTLKGNLGSICVAVVGGVITYDGTPVADVLYNEANSTFSYTLDIEPLVSELACGEHTIYNVASFETNDNQETGDDDHSVVVDKPCDGCTLTLGYWKTHSDQGPAPYDAEGWGALGDADGDGIEEEEGELFFLSGQTYLQVLRTAPAGNVYYILARQYIAAELNIANDADDSDVESAMTVAYNLLSTKSPAQAASLKGGAKKAWTDAASTLDKFNNGIIGPGHCDEDENSSN